MKHLGRVCLSVLSVTFLINSSAVSAIDSADVAKQTIVTEGGKEAINTALKVAKSRPALSVAAGITCVACIPVAGVVASPGLCVACGILVAKVLG